MLLHPPDQESRPPRGETISQTSPWIPWPLLDIRQVNASLPLLTTSYELAAELICKVLETIDAPWSQAIKLGLCPL